MTDVEARGASTRDGRAASRSTTVDPRGRDRAVHRARVRRLCVEGVAARAGVSKATIYRRYPGKAELVIAAAEVLGRSAKGPTPDTGSLRDDLRALGLGYRRLLEDSDAGRAIPAMIVARHRDPELAEAHRGVHRRRGGPRPPRSSAGGVDRGEIRADADVELVVDLVAGPLFYRILINGDAPVDRPTSTALVDAVAAARRPDSPRAFSA